MSKEELFKKYQEIILKTNGGADDYVVALCQISDLIKDYAEEKDQQITDLQKQLADLEAKLAESEKSKESYRLQNEHHHLQLLQFYSRLGVEAFGADIHEKALETLMIMKEQLAEKEKEISEYIKIVDDLHKQLSDKCDFCDKTKDQDKISFALEQLEKVKEFVSRQLFITTKDCNDLDEAEAKGCNELIEETIKEIDNQINELKDDEEE